MIVKDFEHGHVTIAINSINIETRAEKTVMVCHEVNHYKISAYYHPYMLKSYKMSENLLEFERSRIQWLQKHFLKK